MLTFCNGTVSNSFKNGCSLHTSSTRMWCHFTSSRLRWQLQICVASGRIGFMLCVTQFCTLFTSSWGVGSTMRCLIMKNKKLTVTIDTYRPTWLIQSWVIIPLRQLRFGTLAIPFTPLCRCLSEETLKAVGPFYLVSMPGEVKYPTSLHLSWTPHSSIEKDNSLNHS